MDPLQFDADTIAKIQQAKKFGYDDRMVMQKAIQYQASKAQRALPAPTPEPVKNKWAELLPLIGAVGGSFVPGLGTIVGGGLGAAAGSLLKNVAQEKDANVGEALKEGAFAGVGGVLGKGLGFVGSKLFPSLAEGLGTVGEKLAVKAFRPSPGQLTEFAGVTGEDFGQFLAKRGLTGLDDVVKKADILQGQFDNVVLNKNLIVNSEKILAGFDEQIARLSKSILPADQAKAKVLEQIKNNFTLQYGGKPIAANELTALRKEVDAGIKDFALDPSVKTPLNLTRDVFQNSLRDAADDAGIMVGGKGLKETGVELSKMYKALEIGERQANLGRGSLPGRLTSLLGAGIGGAGGGLPGAAAGFAATEALNNPNTISLLSRFATGAGNVAGKVPTVPDMVPQALTRAGLVGGAAFGQGGEQTAPQGVETGQILPPEVAARFGAGATNPMGGGADMGAGTDQDQLRKVLASIMFSKAKNVSDIKTAFEMLQGPAAKPLTAEQQKIAANSQSGLRALDLLENILTKDPLAVAKSKIPGVAGRSPYSTASREIADVLTRLRTGAALNESEQKFYESQLPDLLDSPQTIQYKLKLFRDLFTQLGYGQTGATPDINISGAEAFQ